MSRTTYRARLEAGLCPRCGDVPDEPPLRHCRACLDDMQAARYREVVGLAVKDAILEAAAVADGPRPRGMARCHRPGCYAGFIHNPPSTGSAFRAAVRCACLEDT